VKKLIPIDHGMSFPDSLAVCSFDLVWLGWAQAEENFSKKSLEYIEAIDIMKDMDLLERTFRFRPICLRNVRITTTLLKTAAKAGLNL
jgi:Phosphatidylinositol 3- and 4-kinase